MANDRTANRARHGESKLMRHESGVKHGDHPDAAGTAAISLGTKPPEGRLAANLSDQAEIRRRPLARRALSTARPARVLMR
jgi:hypothetical protein